MKRFLNAAHEAQFAEPGGESPLLVEGNHFVAAGELEVLDKQECRVRRDRTEQQFSEAEVAVPFVNDDIENDSLVDIICQDARKRDQAAGSGIAIGEDEVRMLDHAPDIFELPAAAPRFALIHPAELLDVVRGETAEVLQVGFEGRDHEAPRILKATLPRIRHST